MPHCTPSAYHCLRRRTRTVDRAVSSDRIPQLLLLLLTHFFACRLRLLECDKLSQSILPEGGVTSELVSATISALLCDNGTRTGCSDVSCQRADYELAGQLCDLFQVFALVAQAYIQIAGNLVDSVNRKR